MPAFGGSIIETVRLDRAGRAYEAHLRTQRLLRALVGQLALGVIILPLTLAVFVPLSYFTPSERGTKEILVSIVAFVGVFGLILAVTYLYFWLLRAFAAGSLRAARVVLAIISLGAASQVNRFVWAHLRLRVR